MIFSDINACENDICGRDDCELAMIEDRREGFILRPYCLCVINEYITLRRDPNELDDCDGKKHISTVHLNLINLK